MPIPPFSASTPLASATVAGKLKLNSPTGDLGGTGLIPKLKRSTRFIVAPFGDTRPADYTCANNTANDVEIQAAMVAANALPNGGIVDLLDGTFVLSTALVPLSNIWFRGQGMFM